MKLGVVFPQIEIGPDPIVVRDYVQAVEEMGFTHLVIYDHVLGGGYAVPSVHDAAHNSAMLLRAQIKGD